MSSPQRLIGQSIGKYKIVELLGRGGMAEVYKAYQESLDRNVAIKLMHSFLADEEDFLSRFQREARAMAALSHTNIVSVYDFDVQNGTYYIVMEFVSGGTLKQNLEGLAAVGERMPLANTVQIVLEIADALAYAHSRGMVHRDIKPANIMINDEGRAVLTDFGIAKILSGPSFTATGAMIGTPAYMSPEQGLGQPGDERSDIYALGVLFFQMATGRLPYDADTPLAVILKHVNEPIPELTALNAEIPEAIHQVILKSMAKNPEERYQTANQMANDLRGAIRVSNLTMGAHIPSELLQERPTPVPMMTMPARDSSGTAETILPGSSSGIGAEATRVGSAGMIDQTDIAAPPSPPKKRSRTPFIIGGVVILFIIAAVIVGMVLSNGGNGNATPTGQTLAGGDGTDTPEPTVEPSATETVVEDTPRPTVDIAGTADAAANAAVANALTAQAENRPTDTPLAPTIAETLTPTPNATATFLASCETQIEMVNYYTYQNQTVQSAPVNADFLMNWVIENTGTCPVPVDTAWTYVEGEEFDQQGPIKLIEELAAGEQTTIRAPFSAPSRAGTYESTWQFEDEDGNPLAEPQTFNIFIYELQTPTPTVPPDTPTPEITNTPAGPLDFNISTPYNCAYDGSDWVCNISINVSGGVGPYTVSVTGTDPPAEYQGAGPSFVHQVRSRRCFNWNQSITVTDSNGVVVNRGYSLDPDNYFEGGCSDTDPPG